MKKLIYSFLFLTYFASAMEPEEIAPKKTLLAKAKEKLTPKMVLNHQLFEAASQGDATQISALLARGASPNARDLKGSYPLIKAAASGSVEACNVLIEAGANVNRTNRRGNTPLILAANRGHLPVCKLLLSKGADVHVIGQYGDTVLLTAIRGEGPSRDPDQDATGEICKLLLEAGADPYVRGEYGDFFDFVHFGFVYSLDVLPLVLPMIVSKHIAQKESLKDFVQSGRRLFKEAFLCDMEDLCDQLMDAGVLDLDDGGGLYVLPAPANYERSGNETNRSIMMKLIKAGMQAESADGKFLARCFLLGFQDVSVFKQLVFSPPQERIEPSKKYILHLLWCFKQFSPRWPKDLQILVVSWLPTHELGDLMIARRCNGLSIPQTCESAAIRTLYDTTMARLVREVRQNKEREDDLRERHVARSYFPIHNHDPNAVEAEWADDVWKNIAFRLVQPKLLCNGVNRE